MGLSVLMTYNKTIYFITSLVSLETRETSILSDTNKYPKCKDTPRHISFEIHLSTVFSKYSVSLLAFGRFSRHLKKVFYIHISLPTWLVKISFSPKDFQRHRQARSISFLSSIAKMRPTMTIES